MIFYQDIVVGALKINHLLCFYCVCIRVFVNLCTVTVIELYCIFAYPILIQACCPRLKMKQPWPCRSSSRLQKSGFSEDNGMNNTEPNAVGCKTDRTLDIIQGDMKKRRRNFSGNL